MARTDADMKTHIACLSGFYQSEIGTGTDQDHAKPRRVLQTDVRALDQLLHAQESSILGHLHHPVLQLVHSSVLVS
jgi:hypothetical protein